MSAPLSLSIDVTKLDKSRFYKGKKGTYVDLIVFERKDGEDDYGNTHFVSQSVTKEERDAGVKLPICGNGKFLQKRGGGPGRPAPARPPKDDDDPADPGDDVPF